MIGQSDYFGFDITYFRTSMSTVHFGVMVHPPKGRINQCHFSFTVNAIQCYFEFVKYIKQGLLPKSLYVAAKQTKFTLCLLTLLLFLIGAFEIFFFVFVTARKTTSLQESLFMLKAREGLVSNDVAKRPIASDNLSENFRELSDFYALRIFSIRHLYGNFLGHNFSTAVDELIMQRVIYDYQGQIVLVNRRVKMKKKNTCLEKKI